MPGEGDRIGIWGLGREGHAAAEYFASERPECSLTLLTDDPNEARPEWAGEMPLLAGEEARTALTSGAFNQVVKSPGISLYQPEIAQARERGTRFTSGMNLWFERNGDAANILAVTGTKGKSTCSTMLHALLQAEGKHTRLLGNGGTPALGEAPGQDATILEISSYQAADLEHPPDMVVLTSLYPEHAPWHGSVGRYYADKLRLVTLDPTIPVIANGGDQRLRDLLGGRANVIWSGEAGAYSATPEGLSLDGKPVTVFGTPPKGTHNWCNLALAATAARKLGMLSDQLGLDLSHFAALPHRLQEFEMPGGVLAVDDSISTIPEATLAALRAYEGRSVHLILGGEDRGQDHGELLRYLADNPPRSVCLLPDSAHRIEGVEKLEASVFRCADLPEAIGNVVPLAEEGDVILLSPAAPSYNRYRNFAERGDHFVELCRNAIAAN